MDMMVNPQQREKLRNLLRDMVAGRTPTPPMDPMQSASLNRLGQLQGQGMVGWQGEPVGGPAPFPMQREATPSAVGMAPSPGPIGYGAMPVEPPAPTGPMQGGPVGGPRRALDTPSPGVLPSGPNAGLDAYDPRYTPAPSGFGGYGAMAPSVPQFPSGPNAGALDPAKMRDALRGTYDETRRFDDARAYEVAQAGGVGSDVPLSFGTFATDDNVTARGITGDELNTRAAMSRLQNIDALLQDSPDLLDTLTWTGATRQRLLALRDKTGLDFLGLDDAERGELADSTRFRQNILRNINRTIKEVTGAQMGEAEAKRIRAEMPDVDASPAEFQAKLAAAMDMLRMDIARYNVWKNNGMEGEARNITDAQLGEMMRSRGAALYEEALRSGMAPDEARLAASRRLSEEFGI